MRMRRPPAALRALVRLVAKQTARELFERVPTYVDLEPSFGDGANESRQHPRYCSHNQRGPSIADQSHVRRPLSSGWRASMKLGTGSA